MSYMAKTEDEIAALKKEVTALRNDVSQINFNILRMLSEMGKLTTGDFSANPEGGTSIGGSVTSAVDLGPIEERLDELTKKLVKKDEIDLLSQKIDSIASERVKEAEETIKRVTTLFQSGLEMVKLEATLADVKSLLEETIIQN